jgi:hypothetical protein
VPAENQSDGARLGSTSHSCATAPMSKPAGVVCRANGVFSLLKF